MSLMNRIQEEMKTAMRSKDTLRLDTLRMLKSEIRNKEIDVKHSLDDGEIQAIVRGMQKKRKESAEAFLAGGRPELAEKENAEFRILEGYLPAALGDDELRAIVDQVLAGLPAGAPRAFGPVMGQVMKVVAGRADGSRVQAVLKSKLEG